MFYTQKIWISSYLKNVTIKRSLLKIVSFKWSVKVVFAAGLVWNSSFPNVFLKNKNKLKHAEYSIWRWLIITLFQMGDKRIGSTILTVIGCADISQLKDSWFKKLCSFHIVLTLMCVSIYYNYNLTSEIQWVICLNLVNRNNLLMFINNSIKNIDLFPNKFQKIKKKFNKYNSSK